VDHLPLPPGQPLTSRRARGNPIPERVVRRIQHGAELAERLDDLASQIPADVAEAEEDDARLVLKVRAATRLSNGPFARLRFTPLGEGEDWTYYVLSSRESRELLASVLAEYAGLPDGRSKDVSWDHPKSWAEFLDHIDGIELYGAGDRADPTLTELVFDPVDTIDCLLWPAGNDQVARGRVDSIIAGISDHAAREPRVHVVAVDPRPDRTLVRVVATEALVGELLNNVDVERIRAPLRAVVTQSALATANMPDDVPEPAKTVIGVVDGVINIANPLTGPFVVDAEDFPAGHVFSGADAHGTAVAGTAIWGDLDQLITAGSLSAPHPVVSARVLDITSANTYGVTGMAHVTIEEAIRWLVTQHEVRIVNLSIGYPVAANSALRDELTVTIDSLARELGIVIVVSAGNRFQLLQGSWLADYPRYLADADAKIAAPGDAALAITVGSHAARDIPGGHNASSKVAIAAAQQPSPFTRSGPVRGIGRAGTMKPELTHHGGNWSWDNLTGTVDPREPGTAAVVAIAPKAGRIVGSSTGTSYAAPAVAHEIARIAERYPTAGANLLRALTALSARPILGSAAGINPTHVSGYGRPEAGRVLESSLHRVFLTHEGIAPTNRVLIHRLPIPTEFADGVRQRTFRVALAFDPPVRRGRREYIAGTMSVEFVRGLSMQAVQEIYARQPSVAAAAQDPALVRLELPDDELRPSMRPGPTTIESNTLIRREFLNGTWDPDHGDYFLIVTHNQSAWTAAQRNSYAEQPYALAVDIAEETESRLDLYAAVRARLRGRVRLR
jgi:Subtilase family